MTALLAAIPLLAVLGLMLGLRRKAAEAGVAGAALATLVAVWAYGLGRTRLEAYGAAGALAGAGLEAGFISATILWIVLPALALYELQNRSGALASLRDAVGRVSARPRDQALLVAWFFGLFMEGAAGFGAPIALGAPLLAALGHPPVRAVTLALVGHAAGVAFGALGTPVLAQAALVPVALEPLAQATAALNALAGLVLLAALVWLADAGRPSARDLLVGAAAGLCYVVPSVLLAVFAGPELPTLGGALIGGAAFVLLVRGRGGRAGGAPPQGLLRAAAPYLVIVGLVLVTRLWPEARRTLQGVEFVWSYGEVFRGAFQPLHHVGSLLFAGFLVGGGLQPGGPAGIAVALAAAARRLAPVAVALLAMLMLSRVMVHGGLIDALAVAAGALGPWLPLAAPFVGAVGSFVTGSATASNILLTPFQASAAAGQGLPIGAMAAGQTVGAAMGNMVCPHNVIAGAAAVGLKGRESEILRRTALVCLLGAAFGGAVLTAWLAVQ